MGIYKTFKPLFPYITKYRWKIFISWCLFATHSFIVLFAGYLMGKSIESATNGDLIPALSALLLYLLINVATKLLTNSSQFILNKYELISARSLSSDLFKKTFRLPTIAFEKYKTGELINRTVSDPEEIVSTVNDFVNVVSFVILSIIIYGYIWFTSFVLGIETTVFLLISWFMVKWYTKRVESIRDVVKKDSDKNLSLQTEVLHGMREIRSIGIEEELFSEINTNIQSLTKSNVKETKLATIYSTFSGLFKNVFEFVFFATCVYLTCKGQMTITIFVAYTYYLYYFWSAVDFVNILAKRISSLNVSLKRMYEILLNEKYNDIEYGNKKGITNGVISFDNVKFKYEEDDDYVLNGFTYSFENGIKNAIVGASGNGKTTIMNLITRLFDRESGEIKIDGINIEELDKETLRKNVAIVRQDPFFFNRSIIDNFRMIDPNVTYEKVAECCKMAYIDDYIMSLPNKYDTILGEGGTNLSGGQKQRLAIARSILSNAKIILFDEATSALDNESQTKIKETIDKLSKDRTVIVIAHRLSTIIDSDKICIIENGKVSDYGTHNELLQKSDTYKKFFNGEINL